MKRKRRKDRNRKIGRTSSPGSSFTGNDFVSRRGEWIAQTDLEFQLAKALKEIFAFCEHALSEMGCSHEHEWFMERAQIFTQINQSLSQELGQSEEYRESRNQCFQSNQTFLFERPVDFEYCEGWFAEADEDGFCWTPVLHSWLLEPGTQVVVDPVRSSPQLSQTKILDYVKRRFELEQTFLGDQETRVVEEVAKSLKNSRPFYFGIKAEPSRLLELLLPRVHNWDLNETLGFLLPSNYVDSLSSLFRFLEENREHLGTFGEGIYSSRGSHHFAV